MTNNQNLCIILKNVVKAFFCRIWSKFYHDLVMVWGETCARTDLEVKYASNLNNDRYITDTLEHFTPYTYIRDNFVMEDNVHPHVAETLEDYSQILSFYYQPRNF